MSLSYREYVNVNGNDVLMKIVDTRRGLPHDDLLLAMVRANKGFAKVAKEFKILAEQCDNDKQLCLCTAMRVIIEVLKGNNPASYAEYLALICESQIHATAMGCENSAMANYLLVLYSILSADKLLVPSNVVIHIINDILRSQEKWKNEFDLRMSLLDGTTSSIGMRPSAYIRVCNQLMQLMERDPEIIAAIQDISRLQPDDIRFIILHGCVRHNLPGTLLAYLDKINQQLSSTECYDFLQMLLKDRDLDDIWAYILVNRPDENMKNLIYMCIDMRRVFALKCLVKAHFSIPPIRFRGKLRTMLTCPSDQGDIVALVDIIAEMVLATEDVDQREKDYCELLDILSFDDPPIVGLGDVVGEPTVRDLRRRIVDRYPNQQPVYCGRINL